MRKLFLVSDSRISTVVLNVNLFAKNNYVINVDVHCYESIWYAFVLYEERGVV